MWWRIAVLVLVVGACSSKRHDAPPTKAEDVVVHLGFIPDKITERLGHATTVFAVDLRAFDVKRYLSLVPMEVACARDLLETLGVVVMTDEPFTLYATHLSEINTKRCIDAIAPQLGYDVRVMSDGSYELATPNAGVWLYWEDGLMIVQKLGTQPRAPAPVDGQLVQLFSYVPPHTAGFLLTKNTTDQQLKNLVCWFHADADTLFVGARAEGAAPERPLHGVLTGLMKSFAKRNVPFDETWFQESSEGSLARIDGRIPLAAFAPAR